MSGSPAPVPVIVYTPDMALAYLRVSTDEQTVENQRINIRAFAQTHGMVIPEKGWYEDPATSGTVPPLKRPGFAAMVAMIRALQGSPNAPKHVVVYEVSRLGRSFWEILETIRTLEEIAPIVSTSPKESFLQVPDKSMRQLLLSILAWAAEREREMLVQRTNEGMVKAKADGKQTGTIPLGYSVPHTAADCISMGHKPKDCRVHGMLYTNDLGLKVLALVEANPKIRAPEVRVRLARDDIALTAKQSRKVLANVARWGRLEKSA